jgi:hypothetical protein
MSSFLDLQIKFPDIKQATNLNRFLLRNLDGYIQRRGKPSWDWYIFTSLGWFIFWSMISLGLHNLLIYYKVYEYGSNGGVIVLTIIGIIFFVFSPSYIKLVERLYRKAPVYQQHSHIIKICRGIKNFNSLLAGIEALDQSGRAGGSNKLERRDEVYQALATMRADLICALQIERTFRENPDFNSGNFTMNLEPLKILEISAQSTEYGRLFNQAIQIGMSVHEEMRSLR